MNERFGRKPEVGRDHAARTERGRRCGCILGPRSDVSSIGVTCSARTPLRRLAALGYMAGEHTSVDHITLLRDFIAWEPRPLLRGRAQAIVLRMEEEARLRELERAR